jgi:hypothetical protein
MSSPLVLRKGCALTIALYAVVGLPPLSAQARDCSPTDLSAVLQPNEKAYGPALELSQDLQRGGVVVRCVLRSHFASLFEGLVGAALYRTDRGDFEALFLAPPETFDQLVINERKGGALWVYSFEGEPKPWPSNRMEGRRMQFVKHAHRLLLLREDENFAATLQRVIAAR